MIKTINRSLYIMGRKKTLNESTIRRFMKLADLSPLSEPFVDTIKETGYFGARNEEPELEGEMGEEEMGAEEAGAEGELADPEGDLEAAEETPEVEGEGETISVDQLRTALEKFVGEIPQLEIELSTEEAPEEELPAEEEAPLEELPGEEEELPDEEEAPPGMRRGPFFERKLAERVAQRVASRLMKESKKKIKPRRKPKLSNIDTDKLAERVMKRLSRRKK